ncbi:MAG: pyridoxal-phosphate dependent enzyme [Deltaproteobacteria bacterium]|nr:pyridoxal-phosphate dependent enzyme [Deltaproteobacteria bacterium]
MYFGPTFAEMRDPSRIPQATRDKALAAFEGSPLDPINLYNITWKDAQNRVRFVELPSALTGVDARIVVLSGRRFPTGSHKVGAVYSILVEKQLAAEVMPGEHTLVCPSTGNYGIGGAWVGPRMGYRSLVVLPEQMSAERFERIKSYGAEVIKTPGCESNVKEIFDKVWELRLEPQNRILEQFSEFGNYRFHWAVTGGTVVDLAAELGGHVAAFVSAMGSAGTIAAADRIKQTHPDALSVGLEPIQCPTLYNVGFGAHRIEGIGDKHVTWIHNVMSMDYLFCIDDLECLKGLQLLQEGGAILVDGLGLTPAFVESIHGMFGISGVCNVLGAIKTAKVGRFGKRDLIFTVATDGFDRYPSVLKKLDSEMGPMGRDDALRRIEIFHGAKLDYVLEGTPHVRERWHNQKYFTWVEQQAKTVEALRAQSDMSFWIAEQSKAADIDREILSRRMAC